MCGLVGMAGPLTLRDELSFKALLLIDYFRGTDSTGLAAVTQKGGVDVLKVADDPIILFQHAEYEYTVNANTDAIWLGHNRASTVGASTRANAHPFQCGNIIGAHNGTLTKDCITALEKANGEASGTDSESIFKHIDKFGIEATIPILQGAWALTWYNSADETFNYIKNGERPLWTATTERKGKKSLVWASEWGFIAASRSVSQTDSELIYDDEGYCYFPVPDDVWHSYSLSDLKEGVINPTLVPLAGRPIPPKPPVAYNKPSYTPPSQETSSGVIADLFKAEEEAAWSEEDGSYFNGTLTKGEWDHLSKYGCAYCGTTVTNDMEGLSIYLNEEVVLCPSCSESQQTAVYNSMATAVTGCM